jgi:hypothetical protein
MRQSGVTEKPKRSANAPRLLLEREFRARFSIKTNPPIAERKIKYRIKYQGLDSNWLVAAIIMTAT